MKFTDKLENAVKKNNSFLCIGPDPDWKKLPKKYKKAKFPQFAFNKYIIDLTYDLVCAFKPNSAFYEARGASGIEELKKTCDYIRLMHPKIPIILDAKRSDIGSTNLGYVTYAFDYLKTDAITLHPYLGREALQPFLDRKEKGSIILCKTSNPGSDEFQKYLYKIVALHVSRDWNTNKNCLLVVGATYPEELKIVRRIIKNMPILIPGIGAQGGDLEKSVKYGRNSNGTGMIISTSRTVIFAQNPRREALKLRDEINRYRYE